MLSIVAICLIAATKQNRSGFLLELSPPCHQPSLSLTGSIQRAAVADLPGPNVDHCPLSAALLRKLKPHRRSPLLTGKEISLILYPPSISDIAISERKLKKVSEKRSGPGRPEMNVTPTLVRLPAGVAERIDKIAGKGRRAEFIRDSVEKELKRQERKG
ncbi:ribbon-helix-helix domain-containing protein [Bradyrhizobium neotropicale]|uniref:ribbon-helix-helix domain-containing protein n=1 Tax=Bradyrhizobium neotropicale TaxID=1497615 RepID=UPI001AD7D3A6|nr:ribbon-helix-helix domain-containing protein [Bradyrhizobium neotropicale]MBO4228038.1 hypothetical protein [Bradyrhizobium neotropicale]